MANLCTPTLRPRHRSKRTVFAIAIAAFFILLAASAPSRAFASSTLASSTTGTLATVTLPPLIRFGLLEADPTPSQSPPSPRTSVPTTKLPIPTASASSSPSLPSSDRVQGCLDRCVESHMSNEQAKANCMQSCLKQRVPPSATAQVASATGAGDYQQDHGNTSAAVKSAVGSGNAVLLLAVVVILSVVSAGWTM